MTKLYRSVLLFLFLILLPPTLYFIKEVPQGPITELFHPGVLSILSIFIIPALIIVFFDLLWQREPGFFKLRYLFIFGGMCLVILCSAVFLLLKNNSSAGLAAGALVVMVVAIVIFAILFLMSYGVTAITLQQSFVKVYAALVVIEVLSLIYAFSPYRKIYRYNSNCNSSNVAACLDVANVLFKSKKYSKLIDMVGQHCDNGSGKQHEYGKGCAICELCYLVADSYTAMGQAEAAAKRVDRACQFDFMAGPRCIGTSSQYKRLEDEAKQCVEYNSSMQWCYSIADYLVTFKDLNLATEVYLAGCLNSRSPRAKDLERCHYLAAQLKREKKEEVSKRVKERICKIKKTPDCSL